MIVRRLLTMSRDEPMSLAPTRMDEVVSDAIVFAQPRLERYGIELVRDLPGSAVFAEGDRVQLVQVLINLMLNAADSMSGGGRLTVGCRTSARGDGVILEVSDTGSGIPDEHLPHVFEPFYSTKGQGSGTGLGLSVVVRIIEAHQGTIEVESQVGKGTRFRIELPAAAQHVDQARSYQPVKKLAPPTSPRPLQK
jgi:signal transduction histidine kinase